MGLAAGFDKHAEVPDPALRLGFGFVEVGGVTPLPQPGNPRPRVFRLAADGAVINRYGLNSEGIEPVRARLAARRRADGIVGVNIGPNKDSADRNADYIALVRPRAGLRLSLGQRLVANTAGLRDLQGRQALDELLARVREARDALPGRPTPLLLKIAPDVTEADIDDIVAVARERGMDGMIVSNTDRRPAGVAPGPAGEGDRRPLGQARVRALHAGAGAGLSEGRGAVSADRRRRRGQRGGGARQDRGRRDARAVLHGDGVQGPRPRREIADGLAAICRREGVDMIGRLVGRRAGAIAREAEFSAARSESARDQHSRTTTIAP